MGNSKTTPICDKSSLGENVKEYPDSFKQGNSNYCRSSSIHSIGSHISTYSASRSWSRTKRRLKESTLTLPHDLSKTVWPVTQLESLFLPDFSINPTKVSARNFEVLHEIGSGAFGKVYKVRKNKSDELYALKVLSKFQIVKEDAIHQVKNEVHIQRVCGHHIFIVNSPFHWQDRRHLFIASDLVQGGELYQLLKVYCILPVIIVQLYIAEIALAIDFLHNAGVIHRDLKPENLLLDSEGHLQLTDFGLAKWLPYGSKTERVCGTLHYMAPEVMSFQPYGHAVDWWSLGVIACLMLTAKFPALTDFKEQIQDLDLASRDLLGRLLEVDPNRRLHSVRALQNIAFYKGYNFEDVKSKRVSPNKLLKEHFSDYVPITV